MPKVTKIMNNAADIAARCEQVNPLSLTGMSAMSLGGTSIIIVVGVCLETVKQMESQMMMRHYKGFLD